MNVILGGGFADRELTPLGIFGRSGGTAAFGIKALMRHLRTIHACGKL